MSQREEDGSAPLKKRRTAVQERTGSEENATSLTADSPSFPSSSEEEPLFEPENEYEETQEKTKYFKRLTKSPKYELILSEADRPAIEAYSGSADVKSALLGALDLEEDERVSRIYLDDDEKDDVLRLLSVKVERHHHLEGNSETALERRGVKNRSQRELLVAAWEAFFEPDADEMDSRLSAQLFIGDTKMGLYGDDMATFVSFLRCRVTGQLTPPMAVSLYPEVFASVACFLFCCEPSFNGNSVLESVPREIVRLIADQMFADLRGGVRHDLLVVKRQDCMSWEIWLTRLAFFWDVPKQHPLRGKVVAQAISDHNSFDDLETVDYTGPQNTRPRKTFAETAVTVPGAWKRLKRWLEKEVHVFF